MTSEYNCRNTPKVNLKSIVKVKFEFERKWITIKVHKVSILL